MKANLRASSTDFARVNVTTHGRARARNVIAFIEHLTIPSGKGVGTPFKLEPFQKKFIRDIYEPHDRQDHRAVRRAILSMARKNGKDLAIDTRIATPYGWTTMGALKIGDTVFDEHGQPCRVTFKSPVFIGHRCYRLIFADGTAIVAGEDHQWLTYQYTKQQYSIVSTKEIAGNISYSRPDGRIEYRHRVDVAASLQTQYVDLPIPPYVLAYWLGNGSLGRAEITVGRHEEEQLIIELERELGFELRARSVAADKAAQVGLTRGRFGIRSERVQDRLRQLGVLNSKFIPDIYKWASIEQRRELLQGLMDSDGTSNMKSRCCYDSVNKQLAQDVLFVVRSLGFKGSISEGVSWFKGRPVGPIWRVSFTANQEDNIFRARKRHVLPPRPKAGRVRSRTNAIEACEEIPSVPTQCIQVDSRSHLFLAGEGFTPTHNSALIAALALVHLVGPEAIPNGEIYSAANDRDQAGIIFKFAKQIVELEPELREKIQVVPSTKTMIGLPTGSIYRAVSAEAGTKHGYLPSVVIYDELAQAKRRDLYDVFDTAFGARTEPLFIVISTQSNDPEHVLSKLIDDGLAKVDPTIVCHLYAADEDCALDDVEQWKKANPALGKFRDRKDLELSIRKAMRMPSAEPTVRNLLLNQRVSPQSILINRALWQARGGAVKFEDGEDVYLGLDLSSVLDLTALVMGSADDPIKVMPFFWKPEDMLEQHSNRDFGTGNLRYFNWAKDGHLLTCPGKTIDPIVIALKVAELCQQYNVRGLAYDRWRMKDFLRECDRIGLQAFEDNPHGGDGLRIMPWGQGFRDMAPAIDALELAVTDGNLVHSDNPVLNWNMTNAVVSMDPAGNRKLDKDAAKFRIDGAVALAMMLGFRSRDVQSEVDISAMLG